MGRIAVALAALALAGCHAVHYRTRQSPSAVRYEQRLNFWFWGLVGSHDVDLDRWCPKGAYAWHSQQSFSDALLLGLTLGLYAPRTVVVQCAGGK